VSRAPLDGDGTVVRALRHSAAFFLVEQLAERAGDDIVVRGEPLPRRHQSLLVHLFTTGEL
jgi:hypothetical protein